jgi:hypothetical protein
VSEPYQLRITPTAVRQLQEVPLSLLDEAERALQRRAESPVSLSTRGAFPYSPNRQLYHFTIPDFTGELWYFVVHFRYAQDEVHLVILSIVARKPA